VTQEIVVGTRNKGKLREIRAILDGLPVSLGTLDRYPGAPKVVEDGDAFQANAVKKATELARALGRWVLAEDSGLEVDALDGRPGVYSARYAGEEQNDARNLAKVLNELQGVEPAKRGARFKCAAALARPEGLLLVVEGKCEGRISERARGQNGFGYDPIFIPAGFDKTFGELPPETKNKFSHRAKALRKLRAGLEKILKTPGRNG